MKKYLVSFLLVFILAISTSPVFAETDLSNMLGTEEEIAELNQEVDYGESFTASIVKGLARGIMNVFHLQDPNTLIFQRTPVDENGNYVLSDGEIPVEDMIHGLFTQSEIMGMVSLQGYILEFIPYALILILLAIALLLLKQSFFGDPMAYAKSSLEGIIFGAIMFSFSLYLVDLLFKTNTFAVDVFWDMIPEAMRGVDFLDIMFKPSSKSLIHALTGLYGVITIGTFNFQYAMRHFMLYGLIGLLPIVSIVSIIPERREALIMAFKEIASGIFTNAGHAGAFSIFIPYLYYAHNIWAVFAGLAGINTMAMFIRMMFGLEGLNNNTNAGRVGNMMGLGSIVGMTALVGTLVRGRRTSKGSGKTGQEAQGHPDRDFYMDEKINSPTNARSETRQNAFDNVMKSYSPTKDYSKGQMLGRIASGATKASAVVTLGVAGTMVSGAMGQNPSSGGMLGGIAGYKAGGAAARGVGTVKNHMVDAYQSGDFKGYPKSIIEEAGYFDESQKYDPEAMAAIGERAGEKVFNSETGRNIGGRLGYMYGKHHQKKGKVADETIRSNSSDLSTMSPQERSSTINAATNYNAHVKERNRIDNDEMTQFKTEQSAVEEKQIHSELHEKLNRLEQEGNMYTPEYSQLLSDRNSAKTILSSQMVSKHNLEIEIDQLKKPAKANPNSQEAIAMQEKQTQHRLISSEIEKKKIEVSRFENLLTTNDSLKYTDDFKDALKDFNASDHRLTQIKEQQAHNYTQDIKNNLRSEVVSKLEENRNEYTKQFVESNGYI